MEQNIEKAVRIAAGSGSSSHGANHIFRIPFTNCFNFINLESFSFQENNIFLNKKRKGKDFVGADLSR
jgi:hypothetical protein